MRLWGLLALGAGASALLLACHLVSGVGDLQFVDSSPGGGGAGASTTTSPTTTGPAGGGGAGGLGGAGGSGPALCSGAPQDGFGGTTIDGTLWEQWLTSSTAGVDGGVFFAEPDAWAADADASLGSWAQFELRDCAVWIEVVSPLAWEGDGWTEFAVWSVRWTDMVWCYLNWGDLRCEVRENGQTGATASVAFEPTQHRWWRYREADETLYFETSPDGAAWTPQFDTASPSFLTSARVGFGLGTWGGMEYPGRGEIDNVNRPPPGG